MTRTSESIEYPGYMCDTIPTKHEGDMFQAFGKSLYDVYEERGFEVLHVLSYFNNGLDWFTGRRVKEDEHGFEVIYRFPRG